MSIQAKDKQDTLYFDLAWKKCTKSKSSFYRIVSKETDTYKVMDYYITDTLQMIGYYTSKKLKVKNGIFQYYSEDGFLTSEGLYQFGKEEGVHLSYNKGVLISQVNYLNGMRNGHALYFSPINGRTIEGECVLNKNEGLWLSYKVPSIILLKKNYVGGKLNGPFQSYYENGNIKRRDMYAQDSLTRGNCFALDGSEIPYFEYETDAIYKSGPEDYRKYLSDHFEYPEYCINKNIKGKVYLSFIINEKGEVSEIKVVKGAHPKLNAAAVNVFKDMPNWTPAKIDGEGVSSYFNQVINFQLD